MIGPRQITALVLAGGQGSRMGGLDKGLQPLNDQPLAWHAVARLRQQHGDLIGPIALNANRHLDTYAGLGLPVWPDSLPGQPGPLAGFLTGLAQARTPWLLVVPCDSPHSPLDLALRLAAPFNQPTTRLAHAASPGIDGTLRPQPVFCLLRTDPGAGLHAHLAAFLAAGGRRLGQWFAQQGGVAVPFDRPGDDPAAFANINTPDELQRLAKP